MPNSLLDLLQQAFSAGLSSGDQIAREAIRERIAQRARRSQSEHDPNVIDGECTEVKALLPPRHEGK